MSLLDALMKSGALGQVANLVAKNPQILSAAAELLSSKPGTIGMKGGLGDLVGAFQKNGLDDVMSSWVGGGPNKAIDATKLSSVLGSGMLSQFASKAGVGAGEAGGLLASVLPALVNQVTPKGKMPQGNELEDMLGSLLGGR